MADSILRFNKTLSPSVAKKSFFQSFPVVLVGLILFLRHPFAQIAWLVGLHKPLTYSSITCLTSSAAERLFLLGLSWISGTEALLTFSCPVDRMSPWLSLIWSPRCAFTTRRCNNIAVSPTQWCWCLRSRLCFVLQVVYIRRFTVFCQGLIQFYTSLYWPISTVKRILWSSTNSPFHHRPAIHMPFPVVG